MEDSTKLRNKWKDFATLQHRTRKANVSLIDLRTRLALAKRKRNKILDRGSQRTEREEKDLREATLELQTLENEIDSATLTLSSLRADERHIQKLEKELLEESKLNSGKLRRAVRSYSLSLTLTPSHTHTYKNRTQGCNVVNLKTCS